MKSVQTTKVVSAADALIKDAESLEYTSIHHTRSHFKTLVFGEFSAWTS